MAGVQFADRVTLERHQAFFRAQTAEEAMVPVPAMRGEDEWKVVAECDAAHPAPKTGDGRRFSAPSLVGWSPKADHLFTSCDAFGLSAWDTSAISRPRKLGEDIEPTAYGYPDRFFISQRGDTVYVLQEAHSYQHRYYYLHTGSARLVSEVVNERLWAWVGRKDGLEPWRPGADGQLAMVLKDHILQIVDVTTLPERPVVQERTPFDWLATLTSRAPSRAAPAKIPLHEAPPLLALSFSSLGARGQTIFGFHFHPSGEYVAVNTGDWESKDERRVHIVHLSSAVIVASIPAPAEAIGWSPSGRSLLCLRGLAGPGGKACLWDGWEFKERPAPDDYLSQAWVVKALVSCPSTAPDGGLLVSADGSRLLSRYATVVLAVNREGLRISPGDRLAEVSGGPFAHAAWHPTDPDCFATVGGEPNNQYPDSYKGDLDRPHGRLLRIWRRR